MSLRFFRPSGTLIFFAIQPSDKSLGYCLSSLRDWGRATLRFHFTRSSGPVPATIGTPPFPVADRVPRRWEIILDAAFPGKIRCQHETREAENRAADSLLGRFTRMQELKEFMIACQFWLVRFLGLVPLFLGGAWIYTFGFTTYRQHLAFIGFPLGLVTLAVGILMVSCPYGFRWLDRRFGRR